MKYMLPMPETATTVQGKDGRTLTADGPLVDIMEALALVEDESARRLLERRLTEPGPA